MKGKFVKKLLALSLSAAMMLGNLVPAYAVEETLAEETRTEAPSISLDVTDDDSVDGFYVQNNDDEYSCINCTILPKEIIEAGEVEEVNFHSSEWVESGETIWTYIGDYIIHNIGKTGEYFFVANAENNNEAQSELAVLEDYPIIATVENMEEAFEYQIAESSGYVYFPGKSPDEYTYAEVFLTVTDEWGNTATWSTSLGERMEIYALSTEELSREYATWTIDKIEFHKFCPTAGDCLVTKEIYTSLTEGEPFEEVQTEVPTIMVEKDDSGAITSIKLQNNDELESCVWYGLATREQIEEDNLNFNGTWLDSSATTMDLYLPNLTDDLMLESCEYYFVSYAANESKLRSELAVLEDEPIRITETVMEDTALYQVGDISGNFYFVGNPAENYSRGSISILIDDESTDSRDLDEKNGVYYLNAETFNEIYGEWTIEQVKFYKASANETGQLIEMFIYSNVAEDGTFEEPSAAAPTLALHRDAKGNIIGVAITNHLTHDDAELNYGYHGEYETNTRWSYIEAGETKIVLFDELELPAKGDEEETFTFQCSIYDYENGLWSDTVTLDYPINFAVEEYSGENITVYAETNEEVKWYYVDINGFPEGFSKWYGLNSEEMMDEGHRSKRGFVKTDDNTYWAIEEAYGFNLTSIEAEKIIANEDGMKFVRYQIPMGKITLEEREFSSKEVLLLDYDYYNAFIASGGTITVNSNSEVEVSTDNFISEDKWTLEYLYHEFTGTGIYTLIKNIANSVKFWANQYWVDGTGSFSAVNYYDLDGNIIAEDSILKHDVVLIEYAPEIVWVDSVELTVPETMEPNETAMATVVLDAGQDKYPFGREPQIRYESNNPEVVAVDAETGELTAGTVDGIAKITVYADEDLRAQQGDTNIVTDSVEIAVGDYQEVLLLDYDYYNAFIASGGSITIDANGEVEVSTENFTSGEKWTLEYLYKKFSDQIDTVIETLADEVKEWANKYWKSEEGSFKAVNYYDTEGNSIAKDEVSEHDIVLIEYAPEIVWVDSMGITAPESLEKNETGTVTVTLDAGQDKYPFGREPQIRYASSNPNVLEVDAETGELKAKDVDGVATITVYADEDLRAAEGLDVVTASVRITVGEGALAGGVIEDIVWSIDHKGHLTVTGNGDINYDMPWEEYKEEIVSAYINVEGMTTLEGVFMDYTALKEVDFANSDTSELTVLWNAFNGCSALTKVNMSSFDTSQVRDMDSMFYGCSSLEKLDLSNFDLGNMYYNYEWFGECYALKEIKAPINCSVSMDLPVFEEDDKWYLEDGTEITILPQNLSESVTLYKNEIPKVEEPKPPVTETFTDVKPGEWYVEEIQYVFNKGMMSGVDGETFMPDEPVNRAMVVQTLYKNEGRPEVTDFTKYDVLKDINRDQWWANGVAWGMNHGIVKGYSDTMTFKPENSVTREDLATFLYRYARDVRKADVTLSRSADAILGDAPVNSWAREAFAWAIDKGLIKGITKTDSNGNTYYDLSPETGATRAQMATILMRFCEKYNI